jgi:hypothetical protein
VLQQVDVTAMPMPVQPAVSLRITEADTFRPGNPMNLILAIYYGRRAADRIHHRMTSPAPDHKQKPELSRKEAQQPSVPEGQPQKGNCDGPAVQITIIMPADL